MFLSCKLRGKKEAIRMQMGKRYADGQRKADGYEIRRWPVEGRWIRHK